MAVVFGELSFMRMCGVYVCFCGKLQQGKSRRRSGVMCQDGGHHNKKPSHYLLLITHALATHRKCEKMRAVKFLKKL